MGNGCCNWGRRKKSSDPALKSSFRRNLVLEEEGDVYEVYEHLETIGEGSISTISKIRKKRTGGSVRTSRDRSSHGYFKLLMRKLHYAGKEDSVSVIESTSVRSGESDDAKFAPFKKEAVFALKSIDLRLVNDDYLRELRNEIEILKTLDHPNIVKAYETFHQRKNISIVMELCTGGDLHTRHPYTEKEAALIVGKVLSAIAYMHKNHVVHRDLKFENILFESPRPDAEVKLIDFGLAKVYLDKDYVMTERVGTVYTMSPQVIMGEYTYKADMWALGVVSYMLLSGTKPFWGTKKKRVVEKIMKAKVSFKGAAWNFVSKEAKDFVACLLQKDAEKRLSAVQAQEHKWLSKEYGLSSRRPSEAFMDKVPESIVQYADSGEFKKVALTVIAHRSTAEQIFQMRQAFDQYDRNNDGAISYNGFKRALSKFNYSEEELDAMFRSVDVNENGVIFYTEFLAATLEMQGRIEEHRLVEAFDRLDSDKTGFISKQNLRNILGRKCTEDYLAKLIAEVDSDKDGKISYDEFLTIFMDQKRTEIREIYDADTRKSSDDEVFLDALDEQEVPRSQVNDENGSADRKCM